jgi:hypothetical protein
MYCLAHYRSFSGTGERAEMCPILSLLNTRELWINKIQICEVAGPTWSGTLGCLLGLVVRLVPLHTSPTLPNNLSSLHFPSIFFFSLFFFWLEEDRISTELNLRSYKESSRRGIICPANGSWFVSLFCPTKGLKLVNNPIVITC